jgi:cytochrome oxidase Cu insertion factor (SCO1/SenC/PrrC family)
MQNNEQSIDLEMQRRGRKIFLLMLVFFVVPIIVVILMYHYNWKPQGASLGQLVQPPRLLSSPIELKNDLGESLKPEFWKEKWSVVYVAENCEKVCLDKLHDMRQLHASLYKDIARSQRVLITSTQDVSEIKSKYPDLIVINQPVSNVAALTGEFQVNDADAKTSNRLYLVDPLGHLMMTYQPSVPLADVRKDITRLLRYSWAG